MIRNRAGLQLSPVDIACIIQQDSLEYCGHTNDAILSDTHVHLTAVNVKLFFLFLQRCATIQHVK